MAMWRGPRHFRKAGGALGLHHWEPGMQGRARAHQKGEAGPAPAVQTLPSNGARARRVWGAARGYGNWEDAVVMLWVVAGDSCVCVQKATS